MSMKMAENWCETGDQSVETVVKGGNEGELVVGKLNNQQVIACERRESNTTHTNWIQDHSATKMRIRSLTNA